jgi:hypothetical protein
VASRTHVKKDIKVALIWLKSLVIPAERHADAIKLGDAAAEIVSAHPLAELQVETQRHGSSMICAALLISVSFPP